jgi:hypothetical protein
MKHRAMKMGGGVEGWFHAFLSSKLEEGDWSASRPSRFIPGKCIFLYALDKRLGAVENVSPAHAENQVQIPWSSST